MFPFFFPSEFYLFLSVYISAVLRNPFINRLWKTPAREQEELVEVSPNLELTMAILVLPLITSILKPHKTHFSFLPLPIILHRRFFSKSSTVSALSTSSSSSHVSHNSENQKKASVPTFQQAIQRLQVFFGLKFTFLRK